MTGFSFGGCAACSGNPASARTSTAATRQFINSLSVGTCSRMKREANPAAECDYRNPKKKGPRARHFRGNGRRVRCTAPTLDVAADEQIENTHVEPGKHQQHHLAEEEKVVTVGDRFRHEEQ